MNPSLTVRKYKNFEEDGRDNKACVVLKSCFSTKFWSLISLVVLVLEKILSTNSILVEQSFKKIFQYFRV